MAASTSTRLQNRRFGTRHWGERCDRVSKNGSSQKVVTCVIITIAVGLGRDRCRLSWRWGAHRRSPLPISQCRCPNQARGSACPAFGWAVQGQASRQMSSQRCGVGGLQIGSKMLASRYKRHWKSMGSTNQVVPIRIRHRGNDIL